MTRKKVYALILCLALLIAAVLPGTLAVSNDTVNSTGSFTLDDQQPVEETPTEDAPPADENAPADDAENPNNTEDAENPDNTDEPSAGEEDPVRPDGCTCDFTDGQHSESCALYSAADFDVLAVYDRLLACTTTVEMDEILNALTDEQYAQFTEEMLAAIDAHYAELAPAELSDWIPAVNVTSVAPLLPPVSGRTVRRAPSSVSPYADNNTGSTEGMNLSKTATVNEDGSYKITLEAYATGASVITTVEEEIPTDIVLVLDQSGSMADCINCGRDPDDWERYSCSKYTEVGTVGAFTPSDDTEYYYRNGNSYSRAYYCSGSGSWHNRHTSGWYSNWQHTNSLSSDVILYVSLQHQSRLDALKSAVTQFVNSVAQKAAGKDNIPGTDDDVKHRIAMVGFACGDQYNDGWSSERYYYKNTEVFVGSSENRYKTDAEAQYGSAFQEMWTDEGKGNISASIGALDADGGTLTDLGIEMANGIFNANPVESGKRNRVMIVFTDGEPGWSGFDNNTADNAINNAYATKNTYGATVYTVGIFSGADGSNPGTLNGKSNPNKFMHLVSSNYPKATSRNNTGSVNEDLKGDDTYYLSAGDSDALNNIFQKISNQLPTGGTSSTLTDTAVVKDIISPQFTLPTGAAAESISLETYKCTGVDSSGAYTWSKNRDAMGATATVDADGVVSVTGFNFSENYAGTITKDGSVTYRGDKLVISFTVQPKSGFLGGNDVFTNAGAGIYTDSSAEEPLLTFEKPKVNVPIKDVTVTAEDKNVYLKGTVTADELRDGTKVKVGGIELNLDPEAKNYGLEAWQTEYVGLTVEIKAAADTSITGDLAGLTDDTTYTVTVTVSPKSDGIQAEGEPVGEKKDEATGKINVFKPELTFQDSTAYYGDIAPEFDENLAKTEWKHDGTTSTDPGVTMIGDKPQLGLTYTPEDGKIVDGKINTKQDVPVKATVKIDNDYVTSYTTFVHQDCDPACDWTDPVTPNGDPAFLIHIQTCTLNIVKQGGAADESYVFDVFKDGKKYSEVTVWGNDTEMLVELPVGTYTIKEDTGWSWRFTGDNGNEAKLSAETPTGSITASNTLKNPYWLNGFSKVVRNIFGKSH